MDYRILLSEEKGFKRIFESYYPRIGTIGRSRKTEKQLGCSAINSYPCR